MGSQIVALLRADRAAGLWPAIEAAQYGHVVQAGEEKASELLDRFLVVLVSTIEDWEATAEVQAGLMRRLDAELSALKRAGCHVLRQAGGPIRHHSDASNPLLVCSCDAQIFLVMRSRSGWPDRRLRAMQPLLLLKLRNPLHSGIFALGMIAGGRRVPPSSPTGHLIYS